MTKQGRRATYASEDGVFDGMHVTDAALVVHVF